MADLLAGACWRALATAPGSAKVPADLTGCDWWPALVPGTAAGVLRAAELPCSTELLDGQDWWWQTTLPAACDAVLRLAGLATVSQVWVGEDCVHHGMSMFVGADIALPRIAAGAPLTVVCRALTPLLTQRRPRPRWRSTLVDTQNLRWFRTALLGRIPAWSADLAPVGPWRGIQLQVDQPVRSARITPVVTGARATVTVEVEMAAPATSARLHVGALSTELTVHGAVVTGRLEVGELTRWWPAGYGEQHLHSVRLEFDGTLADLGTVGLREIDVDTEGGACTLSCNGTELFCRGAVWFPLDPVTLQNDPDRLRAVLSRLRAAGLIMLRLPGTTGYEDDTFYDLCDELGLLVWQDLALANLDPPDDPQWLALLDTEVDQLTSRLASHPSVAVLCGGSEVAQQAAMLGLPERQRDLTGLHGHLAGSAAALLPGAVWVDNSPSGGVLPFSVDTGLAHWFGVGAYLRPLADVAVAGVRFASECLAFAVPPEPETVDAAGGPAAAGHHPDWKRAVPRDAGASWDFEDVTAHYVREVFDLDPAAVRWSDPEYALDLHRAAAVEAMTTVFARWRRPADRCAGGLVLAARDLLPGAGWGLLDAHDLPKAPLLALADVLAPTAVLVQDTGLDGLVVHVVHDGPRPQPGSLALQVFDLDGVAVHTVQQDLTAPATVSLDAALEGFRDLAHAFRFGPPRYDVLRVGWVIGGVEVAQAVHLLRGPRRPRVGDIGLTARARPDGDGWRVTVATRQPAQRVALDLPGFVPDRGWFHLAPGTSREICLQRSGSRAVPRGHVRALNSRTPVRVEVLA